MPLKSIDKLISLIAKFPGLGPRSARRITLSLIEGDGNIMPNLHQALDEVMRSVTKCEICHNIDVVTPCSICGSSKRSKELLAVVESVADLWAIEHSNFYSGIYHVLGGSISIMDGRTPQKLNFQSLEDRLSRGGIEEILLATSATLEGQTTAHYVTDIVKSLKYKIRITRLAHGIPVGANLDYLDEGTLALAIKMRHDF